MGLVTLFILCSQEIIRAQEDSSKKELLINIGYFMTNNKFVYLLASTTTKHDGKISPVKGVELSVYIDGPSNDHLLARGITDKNGLFKTGITPSLKPIWDAQAKHQFKCIATENKEYHGGEAEINISKSKITIDTVSDGETRQIIASVKYFDGENWIPMSDVEMKVGIARSVGNSILSAGDDASYTTDSSGSVLVELTKKKLPGDEKGNIHLVAKVEDNDQIGNLTNERVAAWGVPTKFEDNFFDQRALWATRFRTPIWLLVMAYSIVIGVWSTIFYLIFQLVKIKKIGLASSL